MNIHFHCHIGEEFREWLSKSLRNLKEEIMSQIDDLKTALDAEHAAIAANTAAVQSAVTKLNDTLAALAAAQAGGDSAAVQALITQAKADTEVLNANTAALAAVAPSPAAAPATSSTPAAEGTSGAAQPSA